MKQRFYFSFDYFIIKLPLFLRIKSSLSECVTTPPTHRIIIIIFFFQTMKGEGLDKWTISSGLIPPPTLLKSPKIVKLNIKFKNKIMEIKNRGGGEK